MYTITNGLKIEKEFQLKKIEYVSLGYLENPPDGYFSLWPNCENPTLKDWKDRFLNLNYISQIYLMASLARDEDHELLDGQMKAFAQHNISSIKYFAGKYFDDFEAGLIIKQDSFFLDFVFGVYGTMEEINQPSVDPEVNPEIVKCYIDGTCFKILNFDITWESVYDNVFIETSKYPEILDDLKNIIKLF